MREKQLSLSRFLTSEGANHSPQKVTGLYRITAVPNDMTTPGTSISGPSYTDGQD
jgi:hypothetical protein